MFKLAKRYCFVNVVWQKENYYSVYVLNKNFDSMSIATWEMVSLWYKIGELLGFDREDAKLELERLHWKHDQGLIDDQEITISPGRKNKKGFKRGSSKY